MIGERQSYLNVSDVDELRTSRLPGQVVHLLLGHPLAWIFLRGLDQTHRTALHFRSSWSSYSKVRGCRQDGDDGLEMHDER